MTTKEKISELLPSFNFEELDKLSFSDMMEASECIESYIMQTDKARRSKPFEDHDIEGLKDKWINIPLERAIEDCSSLGITPWDGWGEWHLYDKEKDLHYFGPENFECSDLRIADTGFYDPKLSEEEMVSLVAKKYRDYFNHDGLEVVGIMWYNK